MLHIIASGIQLLVILSNQAKFNAKQIFVLSSSMKLPWLFWDYGRANNKTGKIEIILVKMKNLQTTCIHSDKLKRPGFLIS